MTAVLFSFTQLRHKKLLLFFKVGASETLFEGIVSLVSLRSMVRTTDGGECRSVNTWAPNAHLFAKCPKTINHRNTKVQICFQVNSVHNL